MTSLIKNQVLKHLTKFFKDLAPEQLQLSAFKGSCDLSNLQLEENVLMELLSFPAWIKINKAMCDQLSIKIPWTKIKSVPIQMNLNEVTVEVEVCEEFRDTTKEDDMNLANIISAQAPSKYGFVDRVIDGITVTVNNILIVFKSKLMSATFNLSRVLLESRCPNWKQGELSLTRIKDPKRGQILLFKIVDWQTMRLEAKCLTDPNQAPLRLITNHAQCRLTIKKKLDDCSVIAARIFVIFEDILWVLTFAQFISASSFVEYIFSLVKRSPMSKKSGILDEATCQSPGTATTTPLISPLNTPIHRPNATDRATMLTGNLSSATLLEQKFLCYDLCETSLHLYIDKIDAHLYDDIENSTSCKNQRDSGGALQMTLDQIQVDCYPYSRANSDRKSWYRWFDPSPSSRKQWYASHLAEFDLIRTRDQEKGTAGIIQSCVPEKRVEQVLNSFIAIDDNQVRKLRPISQDEQLLSLTVLVKIKDYCIHCVTTRHSIRSSSLNKFVETDKDYHMPAEMPSLYFELNYFYYFDAVNRLMVYDDVPEPLAFAHLSPTKLLFDSPTLVFLNSFQVNLSKAFMHLNDLFPQETSAPKIHCRVEILMPQIILPAKSKKSEKDLDEPPAAATSSLLVKSGKITLSSSMYDTKLVSNLLESISKLEASPSQPINFGGSSNYQTNAAKKGNSCSNDWTKVWNAKLVDGMSQFSFKNQLWAIQFEPIWMDFLNFDVDDLSSSQRLEPVVEPVNAFAFIHLDLSSNHRSDQTKLPDSERNKKRDTISILFSVIDGSIMANMDKVQFGFLQRLGMHVERLIQQIKEDASTVLQMDTIVEDAIEVNLTAYIREIKARLILDKKVGMQKVPFSVGTETSLNQSSSKADGDRDSGVGQTVERKSQHPFMTSNPSPGLSSETNRQESKNFFNESSIQSNSIPKTENILPRYSEGHISGNFPEYRAPDESKAEAIIESELDTIDQLDECVDVANDASCLIFNESKPTGFLSETQKSISTASFIDNLSESVLPINTKSNRDNNTVDKDAISGSVSSSRSIGRSPIEESLLINFDEMEQSSKLFAKMNVTSKGQTSLDTPVEHVDNPNKNQTAASKDSAHFGSSDTCSRSVDHQEIICDTKQKQEIETESISYLELSMSQLMVRRITETKRRQKF